jgi:lipopolysaccharide transport system permease protein
MAKREKYHIRRGSRPAVAQWEFDSIRPMLAALWRYRQFVLASVRREFEARYRIAVLGGVWAILQPLAQVAVYTLVLSEVMRARLPGSDSRFAYGIYLCAGILTWGLFTDIVSRCTSIFVENANLLKKVSFPKICLPAIAVLSSIVNFAIVLALFLVFLIATGNLPGTPLLALAPLLALQVVLAAGLGVLTGVANVFYRDVAQGVSILLQFWFWLTPIVYPLAVVPERFQAIIAANPMTGLMQSYQRVFVGNAWPNWSALAPAAILASLALLAAMHFFRAHASEMVDEL